MVAAESSGDGAPGNPMWQAVDGVVAYTTGVRGYDAHLGVLEHALPVPAHTPTAPTTSATHRTATAHAEQPPDRRIQPKKHTDTDTNTGTGVGAGATTWRWDGVNGNNGVWLGSTKAGLRLYLKGDDPLWQAGVPFDSTQSPTPPQSWSNGGDGGVDVHGNATVVAFSGPRSVPPGGSVSYAWSLLITPVRPPDRVQRFKQRWAQTGSPPAHSDYGAYANATVTVVNVHQGNVLNPWINYPYLTNHAMKANEQQ